jgi:hypothetical protein
MSPTGMTFHGCDVEVSTLGRVVGEWIVQWPCKPLTPPSIVCSPQSWSELESRDGCDYASARMVT